MQREQAEEQPALVERRAGDAEALAGKIVERADRRAGGHIDRAECGGIGHEGKVGAAGALPRHPEQVAHDRVDAAGLQRDLRRLAGGELDNLDLDALGFVETVAPDHVEHPADGAELEDADAHARRPAALRRASAGKTQGGAGAEQHRQRLTPVHLPHASSIHFLSPSGRRCASLDRACISHWQSSRLKQLSVVAKYDVRVMAGRAALCCRASFETRCSAALLRMRIVVSGLR